MKKLLNVLYVTTPDAYVSLDGENVVVRVEQETAARVPLHNLEQIMCFGYQGASPALMAACAKRDIGLCFFTSRGRFLARVSGEIRGNVLLRKRQYQISENQEESVQIAKNFIIGKIYNCRKVLSRALRDHSLSIDAARVTQNLELLRNHMQQLDLCSSIQDLMGMEGTAAKTYFSVFDELILKNKEHFFFRERTRRPPLDNVNAVLSFLYSILANDVASALESVGLDPYVGFLHQDRPGRASLALDMMEELRPVFVDRLALSLINRNQISPNGFIQKENRAVYMTDETKKEILKAWQERKNDLITHPYLNEKIKFGLIPYAQSLLMARFIRGDIDGYPPFFWE